MAFSSSTATLSHLINSAPRTVGTVLGVFLLCNVFLMQAVFDERTIVTTARPSDAGSTFFSTLREHFFKIKNQWRVRDGAKLPNEVDKESLLKDPNDVFLSCETMARLYGFQFLATGWTKSTYRAIYNSTKVAVKTVNLNGHDVTECRKEHQGESLAECYMQASAKILKEIYLLSKLEDHNMGLIKMLGYCVPRKKFSTEDKNSVSIVTELGEPFDVIKLLQLSWEDRLRMTLDLSRLLHYFSDSPLGVLRVNDFRRQQFVLVDGQLKFADLDDVTAGDPSCDSDSDCVATLPGKNLSSGGVSVQCVSGQCGGLNEKLNVVQAGRHFVNFILPNGVPLGLKEEAQAITDAFVSGAWNATYLMRRTMRLKEKFATGQYRAPKKELSEDSLRSFRRIVDSDEPGLHDYHCRLSLSGPKGCTLSVADVQEAAELCTSDVQCGAFVLTNITTWTGRRLAHFKNGSSSPVSKPSYTLYVKI